MSKKLILPLGILLITIGQCVDIYLPSLPAMVIALHTTPAAIQRSVVLAMIAFGIAVLVYGPLSDYYGRRKIAIIGIICFVIGSILCLLTPNIYGLWLGRIVQGLGFGSVAAVTPALLRDTYEGPQLIRAYSYVSMGLTITPIIAPVIGGYLQHYFGWRANFGFLAIYGLVVLLLIIKLLPETNKNLYQNRISILTISKDYWQALVHNRFFGFTAIYTLLFFGEIAYAIIAPFLLQNRLGWSPVANGWLILFTIGGYLIGAFLSSRLSHKASIKNLLLIGISAIGVGSFAMFITFFLFHISTFIIVAPMTLFMFGNGLITPNCIAQIMSIFPEKSGTSGALFSSIQMLVTGLFSFVISSLPVFNQLPLALVLVFVFVAILLIQKFCKL
jgi:Bcr/CflA subfamily drug resistance transporter